MNLRSVALAMAVFLFPAKAHVAADETVGRTTIVSHGICVEYDRRDEAFARRFCERLGLFFNPMKSTHFVSAFLLSALGLLAARGELPTRETVERDGWTIEFSPGDRAVAEKFAGQSATLDKIRSEALSAKLEVDLPMIEARSKELAQKAADLCALPSRADDFQNEFARMMPSLRELRADFDEAVSSRAVAIWRKSELILRLQAGEKIPGFTYHAASNQVEFTFNTNFSFDRNFAITQRPEKLTILPLKLPAEETNDDQLAAALMRDFEGIQQGFVNSMRRLSTKMLISFSLSRAIANAMDVEEVSDDRAAWIKEGAAFWALRRMLISVTNPPIADSYLATLEQRLLATLKNPPPAVVESLEGTSFDARVLMSYAVFRNIAEKHGNEAVTRLLAAFWKLPVKKRTSEAFKKICEKQLKEPFAVFAPRGSAVSGAKTTK